MMASSYFCYYVILVVPWFNKFPCPLFHQSFQLAAVREHAMSSRAVCAYKVTIWLADYMSAPRRSGARLQRWRVYYWQPSWHHCRRPLRWRGARHGIQDIQAIVGSDGSEVDTLYIWIVANKIELNRIFTFPDIHCDLHIQTHKRTYRATLRS